MCTKRPLLFFRLALVLFVASLLLHTSEAAICANFGDRCTTSTPFCNKAGYCTDKPIDALLSKGCNPDASYPDSCIPDPQCKSFRDDFNDASTISVPQNYLGDPDKQHFISDFDNYVVKDGNLYLQMKYSETLKLGLLSRLISTRYVHYGTFSARLKTSNGPGLVNSWIFKSFADTDTAGDEIDFEWVFGPSSTLTQTNVFVKGELDYTKGQGWNLPGPSYSDFHTYTIVYKPEFIEWSVDDKVIRTYKNNCTDTKSPTCKFPTLNGLLFFSTWDTCGSAQGTVEWANGPTAWCNSTGNERNTVYEMVVDYVQVQCLAGYEDTKPPVIPKVNGKPATAPSTTPSKVASSTTSQNTSIWLGTIALLIAASLLFLR